MTNDWLILNYFSRAAVKNVWKLSIPIHYTHLAHNLSSYISSRCDILENRHSQSHTLCGGVKVLLSVLSAFTDRFGSTFG
jgi:hypothetical protein